VNELPYQGFFFLSFHPHRAANIITDSIRLGHNSVIPAAKRVSDLMKTKAEPVASAI
jgi:hypothetical protein